MNTPGVFSFWWDTANITFYRNKIYRSVFVLFLRLVENLNHTRIGKDEKETLFRDLKYSSMIIFFKRIIKKFQIDNRKIFLLDGLGAFASAILLVLLLANLESLFGLPKSTVYSLSIPAFALMVYSLSCYLMKPKNWRLLLKVVAIANILYCLLTIATLFWFSDRITIIGLMYFIGEIAIILFIVGLEWEIVSSEQ
jgi:hypothetical protein